MASPPPPQQTEEDESWLTTYADAITLLMAFFVMLVSFSKVDLAVFEKVAAGISEEIGGFVVEKPIDRLKVDIQDIVYSMNADQVVTIGTDDQGVTIELNSSAFFKPGSAEFRPQAIPVLQRTFQTLNAPSYANFMVEVVGHSDDDPISTPKFPSNWELSAGRAASVVRYFQEQGLKPTRLRLVGLAETQPKVPNRDESGAPIPENQAQNRRIVVRAFPVLKSIIEIPSFRRNKRKTTDAKTKRDAKRAKPAS